MCHDKKLAVPYPYRIDSFWLLPRPIRNKLATPLDAPTCPSRFLCVPRYVVRLLPKDVEDAARPV
jgi:hypothetical protein